MQGVAPFLERARTKRLIASPPKAPRSVPLHENEENEVPANVLDAFDAMNIDQPGKLKSCLKEVPRSTSNEDAAPSSNVPAEGSSQTVPRQSLSQSVTRGANKNNCDESDEDSGAPIPELENVVSEASSEVAHFNARHMNQFAADESAGLPGMDVYRDRAGSDVDGQSAAEDGDEDQSDNSDEDEPSLLHSLTDLVIITKKLSLRDEKKTFSFPVNHSNIGRKTRAEVRERFIGRNNNEGNKERHDSTRQSVSEIEESDAGRPSEVILSNFPLFPDYESGKEGSCEATEPFTPSNINREECYYYTSARKSNVEDDEPYDIDLFMHPDFRMSSSEEEDSQPQQRKKVPPAPPNTPLPPPPPTRGNMAPPPPPPMRRASVAYTPTSTAGAKGARDSFDGQSAGIPEFRRSSVVYLPGGERDAPKTPPKQMVVAKVKPPRTEVQHRTKSRIELGSPLDAVCQSAPSVQSGLPVGSMSVPSKARIQAQKPFTRRLIAVADTNVLLTNLTLVENTQNYPNVVLVIPSAVVRELDGLKNSGDSQKAYSARAALHSLRQLLKAAESRSTIKFQNIDEVPQTRSYRGRSQRNDDRILDCCLYYAEKAQNEEGHKVVLLTNDVALQVKAESFGQGRDAPQLSAMGLRAFYEKEVWQLA